VSTQLPTRGGGIEEMSPPRPGGPSGRPATPAWRQRLHRIDYRFSPYLYIAPLFLLFLVIGMFPLGYTAWVSVHDWSLLGGKGDFVGLANYREVLDNPYFTKQLVNTISIFLISSIPQILIALALAGL